MKTLLFVANLISMGQLDVEGAVRIEVESQEVYVYKEGQRQYTDYFYLDSERLGPDKYDFELDAQELTVAEVLEYIISGQYDKEMEAYQAAKQAAVKRVAELIADVSGPMSELLTLANEFNIPANIKVGKYTNDFRLIDAVDWDSSSMYC